MEKREKWKKRKKWKREREREMEKTVLREVERHKCERGRGFRQSVHVLIKRKTLKLHKPKNLTRVFVPRKYGLCSKYTHNLVVQDNLLTRRRLAGRQASRQAERLQKQRKVNEREETSKRKDTKKTKQTNSHFL